VASCSTVMKDRVRCVPLGGGVHEVLIDGMPVGRVRGRPGWWIWTDRPYNVLSRREEAVDTLVVAVLKEWKEGTRIPTEPFIPDRRIPPTVAIQVRARDKGLCQYCLMEGVEREGNQIDHFIPVLYRGPSTLENLQLACSDHNGNKNKWHRHPRDIFGPEWERWSPGRERK
jgi:5-methylcytosine-specific restriction endonuclease McrA